MRDEPGNRCACPYGSYLRIASSYSDMEGGFRPFAAFLLNGGLLSDTPLVLFKPPFLDLRQSAK